MADKMRIKAISWHVALALSGAAFALPQAALAQSAGQGADTKTKVAAASTDIEEVVVSARRREERLIDVPVAAVAVGEQEIRQYDLTSVANIKIVAPQITLDRGFTGAGASVSMRGVSSSSLDAGLEQSVLLDFDGMALSRGRILNDAMFDLAGIEVLKGPQALFFGKNSPGGVVSVRSADPDKTFGGFVRVGYEFNARTRSAEAAVSVPITDKLGVRLALFGSNSDGYIKNQDHGVPDVVRTAANGSTFVPAGQSRLGAEDKQAARLTLKWDDGDYFNATFKLLGSRYRGQSLQSFDEVMACPPGQSQPKVAGHLDPNGDCSLNDKSSYGWLSPTIIASWPEARTHGGGLPYTRNDSVMPTLTLNWKPGDINFTSVTGTYDYDYWSQGNADATSYSYFWSYSGESNYSVYQELRAVSSFDSMFNFAAGGHWEHNDRTLFVGGANGPALIDPATGRYNSYDNEQHNKSDAHSFFAQAIIKFNKDWELATGGRVTNEKKQLYSFNKFVNPSQAASFLAQGAVIQGAKSEHNFSPETTLSWHPTSDVMVYGAYKTGYLAGGFSNPGTLSPIATLGRLSYDAEKVKGIEIGTKASLLDHRLSGSITAYRYKYEGLPLTSLIAISSTLTTFVTQNAASTITRGVELEGAYKLADGLTIRASANYNDAYFEEFNAAQCYTGQSVAQGCAIAPVTGARTQNLTGRPVYRAPKWLNTAGAVYDFPMLANWHMTVNGDVRFSSGYYTGLNLNPLSYQKSFTLFNAGARLTSNDDKWSFALIGRNLGNKRYGTLGVDKPGGAGEVFTVAGEPRSIVLQGEMKF